MFQHTTVLKEEAIEALRIQPEGIYVDCTLGGGGHSFEIAGRLRGHGRLIAFDQDEVALEAAAKRLQPYREHVILIKSNFRYLRTMLESHKIHGLDGILFDLGVSSPQLDEEDRGFSYHGDAPLDMRMDRSQALSAYNLVNEWSEQELARIIHEYGEEKFSRRIAQKIVQYRSGKPIETTEQLVEIIKEAIPAPARRTGPHPARRTFQALRIAVNDELNAFEEALNDGIRLLNPGGRVAVISFHSLEDRICKKTFQSYSRGCTCPPDFPQCVCGQEAQLQIITRRPIIPGPGEVELNPRARSAKLRVAEKR